MTTVDAQEKLKEEAKAIQAKLETLIKEDDLKVRISRTVCVYAGMITEKMFQYIAIGVAVVVVVINGVMRRKTKV